MGFYICCSSACNTFEPLFLHSWLFLFIPRCYFAREAVLWPLQVEAPLFLCFLLPHLAQLSVTIFCTPIFVYYDSLPLNCKFHQDRNNFMLHILYIEHAEQCLVYNECWVNAHRGHLPAQELPVKRKGKLYNLGETSHRLDLGNLRQ
jgi:hypothetical protein